MMDRSQIAEVIRIAFARFVAVLPAEPARYGIGITSGTSGGGIIVSVREYPGHAARGPERILVVRGSLSTALSSAIYTEMRAAEKTARMLYIDPADIAGSAPLIADFSPDGISGLPQLVSALSEHLDEALRTRVSWLEYAGDGLSKVLAEKLTRAFPRAVHTQIYTASETGGIGRSCEHLPLNSYHPFPGVTLDILEPDESGEGEVLVSKKMPLGARAEEYRIGDIGEIRREECECGASVTLHLRGRIGRDYVKLAGATLRRDLFDAAAAQCAAFFDDYRIEASLSGTPPRGKLAMYVHGFVHMPSEDELRAVREHFGAVYVTPSRTLSQVIEAGLFLPIEITAVSDPFPAQMKESKIRYRID